jgi:hypothetical protein
LTIEDICFAIAELPMVKYANFDHGYHLLSWNQKSPPPKRRTSEWVAVRLPTGCRWHEYLHPAPRYPGGILRDYRYQGIKYSIVRPPVGSLSVLANTIYNQVTNEQEILGMKRIYLNP